MHPHRHTPERWIHCSHSSKLNSNFQTCRLPVSSLASVGGSVPRRLGWAGATLRVLDGSGSATRPVHLSAEMNRQNAPPNPITETTTTCRLPRSSVPRSSLPLSHSPTQPRSLALALVVAAVAPSPPALGAPGRESSTNTSNQSEAVVHTARRRSTQSIPQSLGALPLVELSVSPLLARPLTERDERERGRPLYQRQAPSSTEATHPQFHRRVHRSLWLSAVAAPSPPAMGARQRKRKAHWNQSEAVICPP